MKKIKLFVVSLLVIISTGAFATHLVGSHISYRSLGNNAIEITLKVYRDCYNGIPSFDQPAYVSIFDSDSVRIKDLSLNIGTIDTLDFFPVDTCVDTSIYAPTSVCFEVGTYTIIDTLQSLSSGYYLAYDRCCLAPEFVNVQSVLERGTSVLTYIADTFALNSNQSPYYDEKKLDLVCTWTYNTIDKKAKESDGDSIHYSFVTPLNSTKMWDSHLPPVKLPTERLQFIGPYYSVSNPFGGFPVMLDPDTGSIMLGPTTVGGFLYSLRLDEYRGNTYLGYSEVTSFVYSIAYGSDTTDSLPIPGISDLNFEDQVSISPNPANSWLDMSFKSELQSVRIRILNQHGMEIKRTQIIGSRSRLDISDLPAGLYIISFETSDQRVSKRFIKSP